MTHGIIITHGYIGQALLEAVEKIMGKQIALTALSVQGLSMKDMNQQLREKLVKMVQQDNVVIFASIKGGSCWNAAVMAAKEFPTIKVISGVNLPMVLTFITRRDNFDLTQLSQILQQDGIKSIEIYKNI